MLSAIDAHSRKAERHLEPQLSSRRISKLHKSTIDQEIVQIISISEKVSHLVRGGLTKTCPIHEWATRNMELMQTSCFLTFRNMFRAHSTGSNTLHNVWWCEYSKTRHLDSDHSQTGFHGFSYLLIVWFSWLPKVSWLLD